MPKVDIDYSNTLFYKIYCLDPSVNDMYIGHTTNFVQRKHAHKQGCINEKYSNYTCKLYNFIRANKGWDNWNMEIIAFHNCEDHYSARKIEQKYFEEYNATLNSIAPLPPPKKKPVLEPKKEKEKISNNKNTNSKYNCETCDYKTLYKKDYVKHLLSTKHQKRHDELHNDYNLSTLPKKYKCACGKLYKYRQGLYKHRQLCSYLHENPVITINNEHASTSIVDKKEEEDMPNMKELIIAITRQNQDMQKMMFEQHQEAQKTQQAQQQQLLEIMRHMGNTINNTMSNSNNRN
jgi:hypothetical protein